MTPRAAPSAAPKASEFTTTFVALYRGADGFMSIEQFERFYWPYLKKLVNALVDAGYTPEVFFEGDYTQRLEYLREFPKGKVIARFDRSDMAKVKEVLGGHLCISGNVPSSLLQTSDVEGVKKYCKWLIDVVGKDGGFIMGPGSVVDEVKIKQILAAGDLPYQDISPSQLQHFLIVKDDKTSTLAGVVGLEQKDAVGLLRSLTVAKSYRRQGLAIQLVKKIEEYARSQKVATLYLLTLTAEDFFAKRGYQTADRKSAPPVLQETTEFKSLCPETAVCMKKHL